MLFYLKNFLICLAIFALSGNCFGTESVKCGDGETKKQVPKVTLEAKIDDILELEIVQLRPKEGDLKNPWIKLTGKLPDTAKVYLLNMCPADTNIPAMALDLTTMLAKRDDAEKTMKAEDDMKDWSELKNFDVVKATMMKLAVVNGTKIMCSDVMLRLADDVNKIKITYSKSGSAMTKDLVEVLMKKTGLPKTAILKIGGTDATMVGECYETELAFVAEIDDDLLKMLFNALAGKSNLGLFSPTEQCKTNVADSFVFGLIAKRFMKSMKEEDDTKCQVPSMVWKNQVKEYDRRVYEWETRVRKYKKMLSGEFDVEGGQRCNSAGDGSQDTQMMTSDEEKAFRALAEYIGMEKSKKLEAKEMELEKIMSSADKFKLEKLMKVTEELQWLRYAQKDKEAKTKYALCMASFSKDSKSVLGYIKDLLIKAENWDETGSEILRNLILTDLKNKFMDKSLMGILGRLYDKKFTAEENMYAIRKKLQLIFQVNKDCSSERERGSVAMKLMKFEEFIPKMAKELLNKSMNLEKAEGVRAVLLGIKEKFNGTEFMATADKIFSLLYNPSAKLDIEGKMKKIGDAVMTLSDKDAMTLANCTKDFVGEKLDVDSLIVVHVLLFSMEELSMECSLKDLAKNVPMKVDDVDMPCERFSSDPSRQRPSSGNQRSPDRRYRDEYDNQEGRNSWG